MSTEYSNTLAYLAPADQVNAFANGMAAALVKPMSDFILTGPYGATATGAVTHRYGQGNHTDVEVEAMRELLSPGGDLFALGCRARRLLNEVTETTTNEEGKTQVVVYDVGDTLPVDVDWDTCRVTKAFFIAENNLVYAPPPF